MEKYFVKLASRIRECQFCQPNLLCERHAEALGLLADIIGRKVYVPIGTGVPQIWETKLFLGLMRLDHPLTILFRNKNNELQIDVVKTHKCFSFRCRKGSTGKILLDAFLFYYPQAKEVVQGLKRTPFLKISVPGYRAPHSDYDTIGDLSDWVVEVEIDGEKIPVFERELYGEVEGIIAQGLYMHIPGREVISALHPKIEEDC